MGAKGQILVSLKYWTFLLPTFFTPKNLFWYAKI
jgi:hypothetical protein